MVPSAIDLNAILPELVLTIAAGALMLIEGFFPKWARHTAVVIVSLLALAVAACERLVLPLPGEVWGGLLRIDQISAFVDLYILAAAFLTVWMAAPFLRRNKVEHGEFYCLLLLATVGAMVMASAADLLTLFLGLELLSIPLYVLNAFLRKVDISVEAGLKYFVVGAFASGFLVYGMALLYGGTGTTNLLEMRTIVVSTGSLTPLMIIGLAMVIGALGFKLALFPFHGWAPDVYQGGPTPVTAFLSVVPKGAALIAMLRIVCGLDVFNLSERWLLAAGIIAVASQTLGNIVAIAQRDVKRMLAYSGIAHMGYVMVALIAAGDTGGPFGSGEDGGSAVLVYLAAYTLMNMGAFAAVAMLSERENEPHYYSDLAGQGWKRPVVSLALAICLFSLAGVPPFVGFTAKFMVFRAAINHGLILLAVLGVINSLISAFYYLRVVYVMYMQPLPRREPAFPRSIAITVVTSLAALAVVVVGLYPVPIITAANGAIKYLLG